MMKQQPATSTNDQDSYAEQIEKPENIFFIKERDEKVLPVNGRHGELHL